MNPKDALPAETEVPFGPLLVFSVPAAALWAGFGFVRGITLGEYVALFAGCAVTLLLVQMTAATLKEASSFAPRVLAPLALAAPAVGFAAFWLVQNTNHRPLGAVTFAAFSGVVFLAAAALLSPLQISKRLALAAAVLVALALAWPVWSGVWGLAVLAELGAGLALSALVVNLPRQSRSRWDSPALAGGAAVLLIGASVFAVAAGAGAEAAQKAPLLAGVVGLFA